MRKVVNAKIDRECETSVRSEKQHLVLFESSSLGVTFVIKRTFYLQKVEAPKVTLGILF